MGSSIIVSCLHLCSCLMFIIFYFKFKVSSSSYRWTRYTFVPGCLDECILVACGNGQWSMICVCFSPAKCYRVCSAVMMMSTYRSVLSSVGETRFWWPFGCCHCLPGRRHLGLDHSLLLYGGRLLGAAGSTCRHNVLYTCSWG